MRYMSIVKATPSSEAGKPPSPQLLAAMGQLIGEMMAAGVLEACEGLFPSSYGTRVKHTDGKLTVTDGPFAETKELVGGYAILQVASKEDAVRLTRRLVDVHIENGYPEIEVELRPIVDPESFVQPQ